MEEEGRSRRTRASSNIDALREVLFGTQESNRVLFITGAGLSVSCGIPLYRDNKNPSAHSKTRRKTSRPQKTFAGTAGGEAGLRDREKKGKNSPRPSLRKISKTNSSSVSSLSACSPSTVVWQPEKEEEELRTEKHRKRASMNALTKAKREKKGRGGEEEDQQQQEGEGFAQTWGMIETFKAEKENWYTSFWYRTHDPRVFRLAFPSLGHFVLAFLLLTRPPQSTLLLTQNVDGLHLAAVALMKEELQHELISCVLTREKENVFLSSHVRLPECRRSSLVPSASWPREGYLHVKDLDKKKEVQENEEEDSDVFPMKNPKKDSSMKARADSLDVFKYLTPQGGWRGLGERYEKKKKKKKISSREGRRRQEKEDQRECCQRVKTREGLERERREGAEGQQVSEEKKLGKQEEEEESRLGQGEIDKEEDLYRRSLFELHGCVYRYRCSGIPSSLKSKKTIGIHQCCCLPSCQEDGEKKAQKQRKEEDRFFCPYRYGRSLDEEEVSWVLFKHPGREVEAQETEEKKRKKKNGGDSVISSVVLSAKNHTETGIEGNKEVEEQTVQEKTLSSSQDASSSSLSTFCDSPSTFVKSEKNLTHSSLLTNSHKRQRGDSISSVRTPPRSSFSSPCSPRTSFSLLSTPAVPIPLCPACHSLCLPLCLWFDESIFIPSHLSFDSPAAFQRAFFFLANCDVRTRQQACRSRRIEKSHAKESQAEDGRGLNSKKEKDSKDEKERAQRKLEEEIKEDSQKDEEGENYGYRGTGNVLSVEEVKVTGEQEERGYDGHHDGEVSVTDTSEHDNEVEDSVLDHSSPQKSGSSLDSLEATDPLFSQREFDFSWNDRQETVPTVVFLGTSFSTASTDWPLALQREATSALRDALLQQEARTSRGKKDCRERYRNREMRYGGGVFSINVTSCIEASYEVTSDQRELLKNRYAELFSFWRTRRRIEKEEEGVREERKEANPGDREGVRIEGWRQKVKDESKWWKDAKEEDEVQKNGVQNETKARKASEKDWVLGVRLRNETEDMLGQTHQMLKNENYALERIACICPRLVKGNAHDKTVGGQDNKSREQETRDSSSSLTDHSFPVCPALSSNGFSSSCARLRITFSRPTNSGKEEGSIRLRKEVGEVPRWFLESQVVGNEVSSPACKKTSCESECSPSGARRYVTLPSSWVESLPVDYAYAGGGCDDNRSKRVIEGLPLTHMRRILGDASEVLLSLCPSEMKAWIVQVHSRLKKDFLRLISQTSSNEQS
ncbi:hypothetical protein CSUI_005176 [Cystoisospora suis]|uniref:Uncharacterized protein n=1 Tax=Cystoisospora suis TaxID=483139 RepID=A0A2C6KW59_9APIC|nr:hypothetical protein CSUI_005176 [Cystoisospora suis]